MVAKGTVDLTLWLPKFIKSDIEGKMSMGFLTIEKHFCAVNLVESKGDCSGQCVLVIQGKWSFETVSSPARLPPIKCTVRSMFISEPV